MSNSYSSEASAPFSWSGHRLQTATSTGLLASHDETLKGIPKMTKAPNAGSHKLPKNFEKQLPVPSIYNIYIRITYIYIYYILIVYANHPQECPKKCFAFLFAHVFSVPPNKTWLGLLGWHLVISGVQIQPCPKTGSLPSHPKVLEFWWSAPERSGGFHQVDVSNWGQNRIFRFS